MTDLDKKLREIVKSSLYLDDGATFYDTIGDEKKRVKAIKQAFVDEGWLTPENAAKVQEMVNSMAKLANDSKRLPTVCYIKPNRAMTKAQNLMTGAEWNAKFQKELGKSMSLSIQDSVEPLIVHSRNSVLEAARRASGVSDD